MNVELTSDVTVLKAFSFQRDERRRKKSLTGKLFCVLLNEHRDRFSCWWYHLSLSQSMKHATQRLKVARERLKVLSISNFCCSRSISAEIMQACAVELEIWIYLLFFILKRSCGRLEKVHDSAMKLEKLPQFEISLLKLKFSRFSFEQLSEPVLLRKKIKF